MFSLEIPKTPDHAWSIVLAVLKTKKRNVEARAVVFDAVNKFWRFIESITIHAIWLERLRRIEDVTVFNESHNSFAQASL